jgi:hypothetical protein
MEPSENQPLDAEFVDSTGNHFVVRLAHDQSDETIPSKLLHSWIKSNLPTDQISSIVDLATKTFEDAEYANEWLNRPNPATDGKPPIALLGTEHGFKRVETLIQRLAYGIVA